MAFFYFPIDFYYLILMDHALQLENLETIVYTQQGFNPCFNGSCTSTRFDNTDE